MVNKSFNYKKYGKDEVLEDNLQIDSNQTSYDEEQKISELDFFILIENLNYKERMSLTLYYLENFTTKEISKILKEPESTIRNRISRSIQKLKKIYKGGDSIEQYGR